MFHANALRRALVTSCLLTGILLCLGSRPAEAQNVVYFHGRAMSTWPAAAHLRSSPAWTHRSLSYDGSSRLQDAATRTVINNALNSFCRTTDCVLACYSAGCPRMLLALHENANTSYRILWTEAVASAAGGTELAAISTNKGIRLLSKLFTTGTPPATAIDNDLEPQLLRGAYGHIQNGARAPLYHLAGSKDMCVRLNAFGIAAYTGGTTAVGYVVGTLGKWFLGQIGITILLPGPLSFVIKVGGVVKNFFGATKKRYCGNKYFPGGHGDGAVPVHSAAGYADTAAHASHHDGGPKYLWRAYEQIPLFAGDHRGLFSDFVAKGSLRLGVNGSAICPNMPHPPSDPDASIVYQDADSAVIEEATTNHALMICGVNALTDPVLYGSCTGVGGCCSNFEGGQTDGCTCGEALCAQSGAEAVSYFTGHKCAGLEFAANTAIGRSWDGVGMVGLATSTQNLGSIRNAAGQCLDAAQARIHNQGAPAYSLTHTSLVVRRVYRTHIIQYPEDPTTPDVRFGERWHVSTVTSSGGQR